LLAGLFIVGIIAALSMIAARQSILYHETASSLESARDEIAALQAESVKRNEEFDTLQSEALMLNESIARLMPTVGDGVKRHGVLQTDGTQLVDESGLPVQLRGMSTHGLTWYPEFVNSAAIAFLKQQGGNVLRLAMYSDDNYGGYLHSDTERDFNTAIAYIGIENALYEDLYVIIDWHILKDENPLKQTDAAVAFFSELSERYANNPGIIYEICNEPNGDTAWQDVKAYSEQVISAIRANSPSALILVGTPSYAPDLLSVVDDRLAFDNVMYTYHYYTEFDKDYTHQIETALSNDIPVFISEWGISEGETAEMAAKAETFIDYINRLGLSWVAWSFSNCDEAYSAFVPDISRFGEWGAADVTDNGKFVFDKMKGSIVEE